MPKEDLEEGDLDLEDLEDLKDLKDLEERSLDREDLEREGRVDCSVWMDVSQPVLMVPCLSVQMVPHPWARDVKIEADQPVQTMKNHKLVQMDPPQQSHKNLAQMEDHLVRITQDHLVKMARTQLKENVLTVKPLPVRMEKDQSVRMDWNQSSRQPVHFEVSVQPHFKINTIYAGRAK